MLYVGLTRMVTPLIRFSQLLIEKFVVLDLCIRLRRRGCCLRGPDGGFVRQFDSRRIPVIGSFLASLRGDKSRLDRVGLGVCRDESGNGCVSVECVHEFFPMVELILKRRHLRRSLVDKG